MIPTSKSQAIHHNRSSIDDASNSPTPVTTVHAAPSQINARIEELDPQVRAWVQLRKPLAGKIAERSHDDWSAFFLESGSDFDGPSEFRDELILTDLDLRDGSKRELRPLPQERINRALLQRASWLQITNSKRRFTFLRSVCGKPPQAVRPLIESIQACGIKDEMADFKDWGYLTRFSPFPQSRDALISDGMYSRIGRFHRSVFCTAPMPDLSGSFDALWTSLACHMLTVIPRNLNFAEPHHQLTASRVLLEAIDSLQIPTLDDHDLLAFARDYYRRNLCVALGVHDDSVDLFERHLALGIRCFRLYTIATDERLALQVKKLSGLIASRDTQLDPIEFFVGQITSVEQVKDLHSFLTPKEWSCIDGFYLGNGGGERCKTAETGMIVNTPSLLLRLRAEPAIAYKSLIVEGGVGDEPAVALMFGASGLSHAAGISGASVEAPNGGLFLFDGTDYWLPQRGEASAATKIVEASGERGKRLAYDDGEPKQIEGEGGYMRQELRFISMCGRVRVRNEWLSQCFVKLGVKSLRQLHCLGTAMTRSELEDAFSMDWAQLQRFGDVTALHVDGDATDELYTIPLPIRRRTNAMRAVAFSLGSRGDLS